MPPSPSPSPAQPAPDADGPSGRPAPASPGTPGASERPDQPPHQRPTAGPDPAAAALRRGLAGMLGGDGVSAEDIADVLWVAGLAGLTGPEQGQASGPQEREPAGEQRPKTSGPAGVRPEAVPPHSADGTGAAAPPGRSAGSAAATAGRVGLHLYGSGGGEAAPGAGAGHAVRVTRPPALEGALDLARALRPLRQSVAGPGVPRLDEDATAQSSGEAGRLVPVWRPATEPRFCVDLLVDSGATMAVWHGLAAELAAVLERHGAFGRVRCWSLDTDTAVPRLTPFRRRSGAPAPAPATAGRAGADRWWRPLADRAGRTLLLVLTDGVGPAWYARDLPDRLGRVAAERPAAVLQVLPRRLWHRTALRAVPVDMRVPDAARPVPEVRTTAPLPAARGPVGWLPVMEVGGAWLAPWADLVAGRTSGWSPMLATPVRGIARPRRATAPPPPADPAARVARFRAGASPDAYRLACHLAAAPLSLPVMRLVQQATMPGSGQTDLAELFLSGLIARRDPADQDSGPGTPAGPGSGSGGGSGSGVSDPSETVYDFAPGVRSELLAELTRSESLHVLEDVLARVSGRVAATFGGTLDFRALAAVTVPAAAFDDGPGPDPGPDPAVQREGDSTTCAHPIPAASIPFAEVAVAVLSGAGGRHRALARQLAEALGPGPAPAPAPGETASGGPDVHGGPGAPAATAPASAQGGPGGPDPAHLPDDGDGTRTRAAAPAPGEAPPSAPALPHPELLSPAPRPTPLPGGERLIGRREELAALEEALRPGRTGAGARPAVVVVQGRLGMGAQRLVKEYVLRYGERHRFVHWIDARTSFSLNAGIGRLAAALGCADPETGMGTDPAVVWERLAAYRDWLVVLEGLGPEHTMDPGNPRMPGRGSGAVLVTTTRVYDGRPDTVLTLGPLTRAEIADHVRAVGGGLPARDAPALVLNRLTARLPSLPGELAKVDVRAELARESGRAVPARPGPLYTWTSPHPYTAVAGFGGRWLAGGSPEGPAELVELRRGRAESGPLPGYTGPVRALAAAGAEGAELLAVAGDAGTVLVLNPASGSLVHRLGPWGGTGRPPWVTAMAAFSSGTGPALVTGGPKLPLLVWDLRTGLAAAKPGPPLSRVTAMAVCADGAGGHRLATVTADGSAALWDLASERPVTGPLTARLTGATLLATYHLPNGTDLLAVGDGGPEVLLWDAVTGAPAGRLDTGAAGGLTAMCAFGDRYGGPLLMTASARGANAVWDISTLLDPPDAGAYPYAVAEAGAEAGTGTGTVLPPVRAPETSEVVEVTEASAETVPEAPRPQPAPERTALRAEVEWLVGELAGAGSVPRAAVEMLLPPGGEAALTDLIAWRLVAREPGGRLAVADAARAEADRTEGGRTDRTEAAGTQAGRATAGVVEAWRGALVRRLASLCREPTSDPGTWRAYEALDEVLTGLTDRALSTDRPYGGASSAVLLRTTFTRWAWCLLLRGEFEAADAVAVAARDWVLRFRAAAPGRTEKWRELERISLRARLARGDMDAAEARALDMTRTAPRGTRDQVEGLLALAEVALVRGALADAEESLAWAEEGAEWAGVSMTFRVQLLRVRVSLLRGRLDLAAQAAERAGHTAGLLQRVLARESPEGSAAITAVPARLRVWEFELALVRMELDPDRAAAEDLAAVTDARRGLWTPSGAGENGAEALAASAPDSCLDLYLTLSEQYARMIALRACGPAWGPAREEPDDAARAAAARAAMEVLDEGAARREARRDERPDAYLGFLAACGEVLLAARRYEAAVTALDAALGRAVDARGGSARGGSSLLLPRLHLLRARALAGLGRADEARQATVEATLVVDRLHGEAPHQDRVMLLRARAALTPAAAGGESAGRVADAMATWLLSR